MSFNVHPPLLVWLGSIHIFIFFMKAGMDSFWPLSGALLFSLWRSSMRVFFFLGGGWACVCVRYTLVGW